MDISTSIGDVPTAFVPVTLHIKCGSQAELDAYTTILDDPSIAYAAEQVFGVYTRPNGQMVTILNAGADCNTKWSEFRHALAARLRLG